MTSEYHGQRVRSQRTKVETATLRDRLNELERMIDLLSPDENGEPTEWRTQAYRTVCRALDILDLVPDPPPPHRTWLSSREVKMSREQADALSWLLADADMRGVLALDKTRPLGDLLNAWSAAGPAANTPT